MDENNTTTAGRNAVLRISTADTVTVALSAALIAVCAWISVPMAVPFTLQTFAVFTVAGLFGMKRGTLAMTVYLLLAAMGVPVLSGMTGGPDKLVGPTGGYLLGFVFIALIVGFVSDRWKRKETQSPAAGVGNGGRTAGVLCVRHGVVHAGVCPQERRGGTGYRAGLVRDTFYPSRLRQNRLCADRVSSVGKVCRILIFS